MISGYEARFSCAHFYRVDEWNTEENQKEFGLCYNPFGHGHDYKLIAEIKGPFSEKPQLALAKLKKKLDHKHLNHEIEEFKNLVPTTENLAQFCFNQLHLELGESLIRVQLFETPDIWVDCQNSSSL